MLEASGLSRRQRAGPPGRRVVGIETRQRRWRSQHRPVTLGRKTERRPAHDRCTSATSRCSPVGSPSSLSRWPLT